MDQLEGNGVELAARDDQDAANDDDDEDLDSEAILYKLMQQSSFLMNPNFQDQPQRQPAASPSLAPSQQQRQQAQANSQPDEDLAKSKRVIKLLKSYSHIHQVDDSDDQIRGAYTRYSKPAASENSARQQR